MYRDRSETTRKTHSTSDHHLRYRTPKPSDVVHRVITSLVTMRWPIATGSSMGMGAFQIHDEFVSASLYKWASHPVRLSAVSGIAWWPKVPRS
jgi:hypothetical protein